MKYAEKIKHAKIVAEDLLNEKSLEKIREDLKNKGLYDVDIANVIASARGFVGDKFKPLIRTKLLAKEPIKGAPEFSKLEATTLNKLVEQEFKAIAIEERKKVSEMLRNGTDHKEIFEKIRQDFYPKEYIASQISNYKEVEKQNSCSNRMLNIFGGIGLMLLGGGISFATMQGSGGGRLFYGLILVGFFMMIKGFMTAENPH